MGGYVLCVCFSCPAPDSDLLYRGIVLQTDTNGEKTLIPINAFRFVGSQDQVAFTCQITLCTVAEVTADATACRKVTGQLKPAKLDCNEHRMVPYTRPRPSGSSSRGGDVCFGLCFGQEPTELTHSFLFCPCVCFCLYGPFSRILFHKFSQQLKVTLSPDS